MITVIRSSDVYDPWPAVYAKDLLHHLINSTYFDDRDYKIICMRYGLGDYNPHTLDEIGREFKITRERVRQRIAKSESKLRQTYASSRDCEDSDTKKTANKQTRTLRRNRR